MLCRLANTPSEGNDEPNNQILQVVVESVKIYDVLGNVVLSTGTSFLRKQVSSEQRSSSYGSFNEIPAFAGMTILNYFGLMRQPHLYLIKMTRNFIFFIILAEINLIIIKIGI